MNENVETLKMEIIMVTGIPSKFNIVLYEFYYK